MTRRKVDLPQVLFEFIPHGRYVKVSAVDPITKIEVSIVGDANAPTPTLKMLAKRKLEYVIAKKLDDQERTEDGNLY
jgi:hypothetical protein